MSESKGKLIVCDRCKDNTVFLKYLREEGLGNYGGPGTRSVYEDLPKAWLYPTTGFGHLCPTCAKEFCGFLETFFGEEKYSKLPPCWRIGEEALEL